MSVYRQSTGTLNRTWKGTWEYGGTCTCPTIYQCTVTVCRNAIVNNLDVVKYFLHGSRIGTIVPLRALGAGIAGQAGGVGDQAQRKHLILHLLKDRIIGTVVYRTHLKADKQETEFLKNLKSKHEQSTNFHQNCLPLHR